MEPDFSGWATKAGLKCTDGRTIMPDAFKHQDKMTVPLVWQHNHNDASNVLGHAVLENRPGEGVYCYGYFNDAPQGKNGKTLVVHGDVKFLSIWANKLVEKAKQVFHGSIKEVSLVLAGANPGAMIDYVSLQHADGEVETLEDEAIIYTGLELQHGEPQPEPEPKPDPTKEPEPVEHAEGDQTAQEVYDSLTQEQKDVVHYMIGTALEAAAAQHADKKDEGDLSNKEGTTMTHNVFEKSGDAGKETQQHVLSHADVQGIVAAAVKGGSLKAAVEDYALAHGIDNIDVMFPDAKAISATPEFDKRRTEWVAGVLNTTRHSPFSRIKSLVADLTQDQARAKGYIKGRLKKEEWFSVSKRVTTPGTVYKKQKLDRDDIIDITDFDVVAWMRGEMRLMLDEEVARAVLIGDGREVDDEDKIPDPSGASSGAGIRSIVNDHELYVASAYVNLGDANSSYSEAVDEILTSMQYYKGTGVPTMYTTLTNLTKMLLIRDTLGRRIYRNASELASELGVSSIVPVEVMEDVPDIFAIIVNLQDYTLGSDRGGDVSLFDQFDIDFNQYKYLLETRLSGALTKIRSALVLRITTSSNVLATPTDPTFVESTGVVTIPTVTGVIYKNGDTGATLSAGAQTALASGATLNVHADPASGYYFETNQEDDWSFTRP